MGWRFSQPNLNTGPHNVFFHGIWNIISILGASNQASTNVSIFLIVMLYSVVCTHFLELIRHSINCTTVIMPQRINIKYTSVSSRYGISRIKNIVAEY